MKTSRWWVKLCNPLFYPMLVLVLIAGFVVVTWQQVMELADAE